MVDAQGGISVERNPDLYRVYDKASAFSPDFQPDGQELLDILSTDARVLVIGAGGLGCEILKDLALSGIRNIDVIDLDRIDVTNLNRQFLFRKKDVGKFKSHVAAEFVQNRVQGVKITPHTEPVQNFDTDFFRQFQVIIAGLDNVEARQWINQTVHDLCDPKAPEEETACFLIDGGTEGFMGQARVIVPFKTACYQCTMALLPPDNTFPLCTIKETPRLPEHCIQYALVILWDQHHDRPIDKDSPEDMQWICDQATIRANEYNIQGVTYKLTMGVVKNIIPAIASTNALISASCVTECLKILSGCNKRMDSYMSFFGQTRVQANVMQYEKDPDCLTCGRQHRTVTVNVSMKVSDLRLKLIEDFNLENPTLSGSKGYLMATGVFASKVKHKLELTFEQLVEAGEVADGAVFTMTDKKIPTSCDLTIKIDTEKPMEVN